MALTKLDPNVIGQDSSGNSKLNTSGGVVQLHSTGLFTVANTSANNFMVAANGNIGIGNATPSNTFSVNGTLHVSADTASTTTNWFFNRNANNNAIALQLGGGTGGGSSLGVSTINGNFIRSFNGSVFAIGTDNAASLVFGTADTERVRVDSSGRVIIGNTAVTASSSEKFEVYNGMSLLDFSSDSIGSLYVRNRSTTADTIQPYIYFTDGGGNRGGIGVKYTDSSIHQYGQGGFNWYTGSSGFSGLRMTMSSAGNLLVGTNSIPSYVSSDAGSAVISAGGSTSGTGQLAIVGSSGAAAELLISGGNSSTNRRAGIRFWSQQYSNTGPAWTYGVSYAQTNGDGNLYWINNAGTTSMLLSQAGNLGIGTTSPTTNLDVNPGGITYAYNAAVRFARNATGAGQNVLVVEQAGASSSEDFTLNAKSSSYTNSSTPGWGQYRIMCERTASSVWNFMTACSGGGNDVEFYLRGDGQAYADGSWNGGGADYAEYFESVSGDAIDVGVSVVLEQGKVRAATANDNPSNIIGVVRPRGTSATIGNTAQAKWAKKYLTDDYGAPLMEEFTEVRWKDAPEGAYTSYVLEDIDPSIIPDGAEYRTVDDDGLPLVRRVVNPEYNPDVVYTPRENRPEWNVVGLLGQIPIKKGSPVGSGWIKMWDVSDTVEMWMVR